MKRNLLGLTNSKVPLETRRFFPSGDITVCAYCGAAMVFGKDLRVAPISRQLWATLGAEEKGHISRAQHIIRAMRPETLH